MIGDESIMSPRPSSPTSTGQTPTLRHAAAASRQSSGGSSSETNCSASTPSTTCVETRARECGLVAAHGFRNLASGVRFETRSVSRNSPAGHLDRARLDQALDRPAAARIRTPTICPSGPRNGSTHRPPGKRNGRLTRPGRELAQRHLAESHLALLGLLPGVEDLSPTRSISTGRNGRLAAAGHSRPRAIDFSHLAVGQVQEADDRLDRRRRVPADQALGLDGRGLAAALGLAIGLGVEPAEVQRWRFLTDGR